MANSTIPYESVQYATPTKTDSSIWVSGTVSLRRKNGVVQIKIDGATFGTISNRATFATVPSGWEPATETYFFDSAGNRSYLIKTNGEIQANAQGSGQVWGTGMYLTA